MKISVIIPVYNGKNYILETIGSVKKQTLVPHELIVIDDGSNDGSFDLLNTLTLPFPLRVLKQTNQGQSASRNHGVEISTGDFIAFLDQDDVWYPQHLEKLSMLMQSNERLGWVYHNFDLTDEKSKVTRQGHLNYLPIPHPKTTLEGIVKQDAHILPSAALVRKKAFVSVGMFNTQLSGYEDDDLFIRMFTNGWENAYLNESLSTWRIHSSSSGHSNRMRDSRKLFFNIVRNQHPQMTPFLGVRMFNSSFDWYKCYLKQKNDQNCIFMYDDLKYYTAFAPLAFKLKWKPLLLFFKYPLLIRFLKKIILGK